MMEGRPGADSEEKHEPVSDIDTAVADSLKVLDLKRPIREADSLCSRVLFPGVTPFGSQALDFVWRTTSPPFINDVVRCCRRARGGLMKRRDFIPLLGGTAVTLPLAARAQQPATVPRVGILSPAASEAAATLTAFREAIRDLGYVEGQTIALDFRLSKGIMDAIPALAAELV